MVSNKLINISKMSTAGVTKISIRKSIENNIDNLLFSFIKWYVLAFNSMLSVSHLLMVGRDERSTDGNQAYQRKRVLT